MAGVGTRASSMELRAKPKGSHSVSQWVIHQGLERKVSSGLRDLRRPLLFSYALCMQDFLKFCFMLDNHIKFNLRTSLEL